MTSTEIGALVAAAIAFFGALTAYLNSVQARRAVQMHMQLHHRHATSTARQTGGNSDNGNH